VEKIRKRFTDDKKRTRDLPDLGKLAGKPSLDEIEKQAQLLFGPVGNGMARKASIYCSHHYSGKSLKELGEKFLLSQSGVSQTSRRFEQAMTADQELRERIKWMMQGLGLYNV
jgi:hypothetical protein